MNITTYLTSHSTGFGPFSITFLVSQILGVIASLYLAFVRKDSHALRGPLLKQLGYVVTVLSVLGVLFSILRITDVNPFQARYWSYIVAALELVLAIVALYYSRAVYPARAAELAASQRNRRPSSAPRTHQQVSRSTLSTNSGNGNQPIPINEPRIAGGRRDARRDRKRRKG